MIIRLTIVLLLIGTMRSLASEPTNDSLSRKSFDYLFDRIDNNAGTPIVRIYLAAYMEKARKRNDWSEIYNAYKNYLYESPSELRLTYSDSMVYVAEITTNNKLIGDAFLTRGVIHYNLKNHVKALDNYIIANRYIARVSDDYLKYKIKYNIALIKYYLGYYNEALSLFLESAEYFKVSDQRAYANCLHNLALTYNRLDKIKESVIKNAEALLIAKKNGYTEILPHIRLLEGVNLFYTEDFGAAVNKISQSIFEINRDSEFASMAVAYFYLGRSYWEMGNKDKAVKYFVMMDRVVKDNDYIRPDLRPAYDMLIEYYHYHSDMQRELFYIKKLLKLDRLIESNFKYLSKKIHKNYDTYTLTESKVQIESELQHQRVIQYISFILIALLMAGLCYAIFSHFRMKKTYKQRFEDFIVKKGTPTTVQNASNSSIVDINSEVVASLLKKLEEFEGKKGFLKKDITANSLCKDFQTNYKYLTKVIHHYRNKNFTAYLNDLRIEYIVGKLKENTRIRNYTNAALAGEAGFSTTQHFTRAFVNKVQIPPSFFIQELDKLEARQN